LISRSLKGRTSATEEEALRAWRRQSADNEAYYRQLTLLLEEAEAALFPGVAVPAPPLAALTRTPSAAAPSDSDRFSGRGRWRRGGVIAVAAAAAMVVLFLHVAPDSAAPGFSLQAGEFVTGPTETATAVLSDGTVVRLAPGSRLRIPDGAGGREVVLDGRAYFAVTEMAGHPFRVRTAAGEALVLGTRFEVRVLNDELRLIVLEGLVALDAGGHQVEVGAGEMSVATDGSTTTPVKVEDMEPLVGWLKRFLVFQGTPLHEAARALEREYGVPVVVTDSVLAQETVTGWYADRAFDEVLSIVCGVMQARCSMEDGTAVIRPH
jgi:ferric-dicitrate binding protein FerR (iron transport regulator)